MTVLRAVAALALALVLAACAHLQPAAPDPGRFLEWEDLAVEGLPPQHVSIWLPPEYAAQPERRFPVLYMWDGQNLFDPAKTHYGKAWMVQDVLSAMVASGKAEPHIVVGIWSPPGLDRYRVYVPQFAAQTASGEVAADIARMAGGPVASKAQLDWVADDLKARIDGEFRTHPSPADTTIVGASMGGIMACYAAIERPETFARAGCVSAHLALIDPELAPKHGKEIAAIWDRYLDAKLGQPNGRRLWLDHGTATLDGYYGPWQEMLAGDLESRGWQEGSDFTARVYQGAEHDEVFWNRRMPDMLEWLWRKD